MTALVVGSKEVPEAQAEERQKTNMRRTLRIMASLLHRYDEGVTCIQWRSQGQIPGTETLARAKRADFFLVYEVPELEKLFLQTSHLVPAVGVISDVKIIRNLYVGASVSCHGRACSTIGFQL
jgi:hypothetical protein